MDRREFIQFLTLYNNRELSMDRAKKFLINYCVERGKKYDRKMEKFVTFAIMYNSSYLAYAVQWYRIKFQVNELYKVLPNGARQLILIY